MCVERKCNMDDVVTKIMDSDRWPNIEFPENLELLNEMADESFSSGTFSGTLSAALMYHQLIEAMCQHLLEDCHFLIQLSLHPMSIDFSVSQNKMLGFYVNELKESVNFYKKEDFLMKVTEFNTIRNSAIHGMRKSNLEEVSKSLEKAKYIFDEIYNLYDKIEDEFRVNFHSFQKDVFLDEYEEE